MTARIGISRDNQNRQAKLHPVHQHMDSPCSRRLRKGKILRDKMDELNSHPMNLSIYCFEFSRPSSWSSLLPEQRLAPWDLHDLKCPRFSHTPWTKSPLRVQKRSLPENHLCVSWRENSKKQKLPISPSIKIFPRNAENFIFINSFQFFDFFFFFRVF